jgi:hypothetical protein
MNESLLQQAEPTANREASTRPAGHVLFDGRHPKLRDHHGYALQITTGHVDVFAISSVDGNTEGARHHLFRVESGEIILDLQSGFNSSDAQVQVLAVGSLGAEALLVPRADIQSADPVTTWVRRLARLIAGPNPSWDMQEVPTEGAAAIPAGERRRGPGRSIVWVSLEAGTAKPMGLDPAISAGGPPLPLTSGMWIEAGPSGCNALGTEQIPDADQLWRAVDRFHLGVASCVREYLAYDAQREARRLVLRRELIAAQTAESFERLSNVVVQRSSHTAIATDSPDPLFNACRIVVEAIRPGMARHVIPSR